MGDRTWENGFKIGLMGKMDPKRIRTKKINENVRIGIESKKKGKWVLIKYSEKKYESKMVRWFQTCMVDPMDPKWIHIGLKGELVGSRN